jgi:hypothetical protein
MRLSEPRFPKVLAPQHAPWVVQRWEPTPGSATPPQQGGPSPLRVSHAHACAPETKKHGLPRWPLLEQTVENLVHHELVIKWSPNIGHVKGQNTSPVTIGPDPLTRPGTKLVQLLLQQWCLCGHPRGMISMQGGPEISTRTSPLVLLPRRRAEEHHDVCDCLHLISGPNKPCTHGCCIFIFVWVLDHCLCFPERLQQQVVRSRKSLAKYASVICFHTRKSPLSKASSRSMPWYARAIVGPINEMRLANCLFARRTSQAATQQNHGTSNTPTQAHPTKHKKTIIPFSYPSRASFARESILMIKY